MHDVKVRPTPEEVKSWLVETVRHSLHMEYYLRELQIGSEDPQRPHDIVGEGNKFEFEVIKGFAVQYRSKRMEWFTEFVAPSLLRHRIQHHHREWEEQLVGRIDGKLVGAVDSVCSLLEDRRYQGGARSWMEISEIAHINPEHKRPWMLQIIPHMREIARPKLNAVNWEHIPNLGVDKDTYQKVLSRLNETITMLKNFGYEL